MSCRRNPISQYFPVEKQGLLKSTINKVQIEIYLLGYQYCRRGDDLQIRLLRGYPSVNPNQDLNAEHRTQLTNFMKEKSDIILT